MGATRAKVEAVTAMTGLRPDMYSRFIDPAIDVEVLPIEGKAHRFLVMGNEVRAWVWCLDCDCHGRDCPDLSPPEVRERYLKMIGA